MKKIIIFLIMMLLMTGCGTSDKNTTNKQTVDEQFLVDFKTGLENRWANDGEDYEVGSKEEKNNLQNLVNLEMECISKYLYEDFEDKTLENYAQSYITSLENQNHALSYYFDDFEQYLVLWYKSFIERANCLSKILNNYNVDIDPSYHYKLNYMSNLAFLSNNGVEVFDMLNKYNVYGNEKIIPNGDSYAVVVEATNTTDYCFKELELYLAIWNGDEIADTCEAIINEWRPGETIEITFEPTTSITDYYYSWVEYPLRDYFMTNEDIYRIMNTWDAWYK